MGSYNVRISPFDSNPNQNDSNSDGIGDVCSDIDEDGVIDAEDNCPSNFNPLQAFYSTCASVPS